MAERNAVSAGARLAKRIVIEGAGWILVLIGLAALVLPGPGLLALFAGVALLSSQYQWAQKRLEPVKKAALRTAADSVSSTVRITMSVVLALGLIAIGLLWGLHPPAPSWWPVAERWWLLGGWGAGASLILSGLIALGTIVYSYLNFRERPVDGDPARRVAAEDRTVR
ncbi:MAG: PGPGW domain-containing protein [Ornithinimicrobium sp.]